MESCSDFYFQQKAEEGFAGRSDFDDESNKLDGSISESSMEETEGEDDDEGTSSSSSSSNGPLQDMSSLLNQPPIKRGLSKHYQGKSQSFTSLSNVLSLEDLAKPENPYSKKLKSCRSYAGGLSDQSNGSSFSRIMSKKASRGSCLSQMCVNRDGSFRPPMAPHRSASSNRVSNHTALFA